MLPGCNVRAYGLLTSRWQVNMKAMENILENPHKTAREMVTFYDIITIPDPPR
jgi:hypothetical protein